MCQESNRNVFDRILKRDDVLTLVDSLVFEWARENGRLLSRKFADKVNSIPLRYAVSKMMYGLNAVAEHISYHLENFFRRVLSSDLFKERHLVKMGENLSWSDQLLISSFIATGCLWIPLSQLYIRIAKFRPI